MLVTFERPGHGPISILSERVLTLAPYEHGDGSLRTAVTLDGGVTIDVEGGGDEVAAKLGMTIAPRPILPPDEAETEQEAATDG